MRKILFATSEVNPLIKTGGLADVSASLPIALHEHGQDIRIIMPAYRKCLQQLKEVELVATLKLDGYQVPVDILQAELPGSGIILWLLHSPLHFDREGGPYSHPDGHDWEDNAARFAMLSRAAASIALKQAGLNWQPDILHCNDWQTGLAQALVADAPNRPATIFTIHNLAYQGLYPHDVFKALDLPEQLWQTEGLEFYGLMSFMKGGLIYSDQITTVSPTYAGEICSHEFGCGLEGLLSQCAQQQRLNGILNGIDYQIWNPQTDPFIAQNYSAKTLKDKVVNKTVLQQRLSLPVDPDCLLIGLISRLVAQKGIDLSILALESLLNTGQDIQFVCLGSGEPAFEQDLLRLNERFPDMVAVMIGYDEIFAHQIEAAADIFLMPSRFEPCGLNQMYSLRYGTLPVVRNTGGLADTVVDASDENCQAGTATGFKFDEAAVDELIHALHRAIARYQDTELWQQMMVTAMACDNSWEQSANTYIEMYHRLT